MWNATRGHNIITSDKISDSLLAHIGLRNQAAHVTEVKCGKLLIINEMWDPC